MSAVRLVAQKQGTKAFINAWKKLDVDEIISLRTADCVQANGPGASLGDHEMTNDQLSAMIKPLFAQLTNFKVDVLTLTHDAEVGKSVVHAKTSANTPVGPYTNEHISIMTFDGEGKKVIHFYDLMDSAFLLDLKARLGPYMAAQAKN